ncbi:MAG: DUF4349 domain-containing protein [Clostridia bacterium]|nr:DUF4349 domain-containing protein [Clostridia bacterium]
MKYFSRVMAVLVAVLMVVFAAGCSSGAGSNKSAAHAPDVVNGTAENGLNTDEGTYAQNTPATTSSSAAPAKDSRKIIKTAQINLETVTYDSSIVKLEAIVAQYGGYIQDSEVQGRGEGSSTEERTASYTVMVPAPKLSDFLGSVGNVGKIRSKVIKGEDVTQQYTDTQSKLKMLDTEQDRLLDFMKKASTMADMLTVEKQLTEVQTQIEELTTDIKQWDTLVSLSTVTITVSEVSELTTAPGVGFGGKIASFFSASVKALGKFIEVITLGLVAALPFLVFFGVIAVIVLVIIRFTRRRRKKKLP